MPTFCLYFLVTISFLAEYSESIETIGDTGLTTDTYYYIKERSGKYLRWDGNYDYSLRGLYFDSVSKDNYRKDWYLFRLEILDGNRVKIINAKTNASLMYWNSTSHLILSDKAFAGRGTLLKNLDSKRVYNRISFSMNFNELLSNRYQS